MRHSVIAIFAILCALNFVKCAPAEENPPGPHYSQAKILDQSQTMHENGDYEFKTTREDGTYQEEYGKLKEVAGSPTFHVTGVYTYIDDEAQTQTVHYEADEMGFRAQSTADPQ